MIAFFVNNLYNKNILIGKYNKVDDIKWQVFKLLI